MFLDLARNASLHNMSELYFSHPTKHNNIAKFDKRHTAKKRC